MTGHAYLAVGQDLADVELDAYGVDGYGGAHHPRVAEVSSADRVGRTPSTSCSSALRTPPAPPRPARTSCPGTTWQGTPGRRRPARPQRHQSPRYAVPPGPLGRHRRVRSWWTTRDRAADRGPTSGTSCSTPRCAGSMTNSGILTRSSPPSPPAMPGPCGSSCTSASSPWDRSSSSDPSATPGRTTTPPSKRRPQRPRIPLRSGRARAEVDALRHRQLHAAQSPQPLVDLEDVVLRERRAHPLHLRGELADLDDPLLLTRTDPIDRHRNPRRHPLGALLLSQQQPLRPRLRPLGHQHDTRAPDRAIDEGGVGHAP